MGAIATRLGIRITDGALFPYTALTEKQHDMRPWNGPMEHEWVIDTREARARRLKWLENDRGAVPTIVDRSKPFSIATADKAELIEYVANEFGETLDARLPVLVLRRQALALAAKQIEEQESAERAQPAETQEAAQPAVEAPSPAEPTTPSVEPATTARSRGLGRRAA